MPRALAGALLAFLLAVGALAGGAAPASAAAQATPNACLYSVDGFYRDMPVTVDADATILTDAGQSGAPDVTPGRTLKTTEGTFSIELPTYLAQFGYAGGFLGAGENTVTARVWLAVQGTNTREGVQVVGPVDVTASTTITTDPAEADRFLSATPWVYSHPVLPELTWTATGGDVAFSQADGEAFARAQGAATGKLPVGVPDASPAGYADRTVHGSAVIHIPQLVPSGTFFLDCLPGLMTNPTYDFGGSSYDPRPAVPFATKTASTNNVCLNQAGRKLSGATTGLPAGQTRELDPAKLTLSRAGGAPTFSGTSPFTLDGTSLHAELTGSTIAALARHPGGSLITSAEPYPVKGWVTVSASNTVEGRRTVPFTASYTPRLATPGPEDDPGADPVWDPASFTAALPAITWTPTRKGPVEFRVAPAGSSDPVTLTGPATGGPEGPVVTTTFPYAPYGSTVLSLGTDANDTTLDCASAIVTVADDGIAWSNRGAVAPPTGSLGRYSVVAGSGDQAFATATDPAGYDTGTPSGPDTSPGTVDPPPLDGGTLPPPPGPGTKPPAKRPERVASIRIPTQKLRVAKGGVAVRLDNLVPARTTGALSIATKQKLRIGKAKARRIVVGTGAKVSLGGGRTGRVRVRLSVSARKLLRGRRSVTVTVTFTPAKASTQRTIHRTLTLRR